MLAAIENDIPLRSHLTQWSGTLRTQEVVISLFGEYAEASDLVWVGGLVELLGDLGITSNAARVAVSRLHNRNLFESRKDGRHVFYQASGALRKIIKEGRRHTYFQFFDVEWQGKWTFVTFSVPEGMVSARRRFSRWLKFSGFGILQDGVWIAPNDRAGDIHQIAESLGLKDHVVALVGALGDESQLSNLVGRVWDIDALSTRYAAYVSQFEALHQLANATPIEVRDAFVLRTYAIEKFRQISELDPRLPGNVLGIDWQRRKAAEVIRTIKTEFEDRAAEHFAAKTRKQMNCRQVPAP